MKPDTVLTLGEFEFADTEVPERISFGGRQNLAMHQLVGGGRIVDAMGRNDMPLGWSGLLRGEEALVRARYLDGLRIAGKEINLRWSELAYSVVIEEFQADFERFYRIPYRISCCVVRDLAVPVTELPANGVDAAIRGDMSEAEDLGEQISDDTLSDVLETLDTAISAVSDFAKAAQSTIKGVLEPIAAVQQRVGILITSVGNTVANVTTLGGVLPNNPIAQQASRVLNQVTAMQQLPKLYNLQSVVGRMSANLGTIGGGSKILAVGGGNLFSIAQKIYNDPTCWTTLANANGLSDPQIQGLRNIIVPKTPDDNDGVLTA
jgi:hypothetical protein